MALAVRSVWDPFGSLVRQFDADFDSLVRRAFGTTEQGARAFVPAADVVRDGTDVVVTLELPGVDVDKDVDVEVADGRLLITGRRAEERTDESGGVLVRETRSGEFRRQFSLPAHVSAEHVEAEYDRGLLRIRVRNVAQPEVEPRKITIRTERPEIGETTE
jgi:HSP20 family protein